MADENDNFLLREYAERNSESAFNELVQRHINFVYSVAMRYVGNPPDAQDVTQAVFVILAQKSSALCRRTTLTGWLYETTRLTSRQLMRGRARRLAREQEAYMQFTSDPSGGDALWCRLAPHLEEAMSRLRAADRELLALRFYENKTGAEAAVLLGIGAAAAHKRTNRALEKLQSFFARRGVSSTTAIIAGAISNNSVQAAPVGLAQTISTIALAKGAVASTSTLTLVKGALKLMAWSKTKTAIVAGAIALLTAAVATVSIYEILTMSGSFVKITGKGQIETYDYYSQKARVIETADMTIWTDGKSYRISIISKGQLYRISTIKFGTWDVNTLQAQYGSDGTDIFALSDEFSLPVHPSREGFGGYAYAGRFPGWDGRPSVPMIVQAAWLAYCSSDYFNVSSNRTGLDLRGESRLLPDSITNLVAYWKNSTLPQNITGWSSNWVMLPGTNSDQPDVATELKQYPGGFKAFKLTAADPVIVGNKQWPREITLETFWPKHIATNGDDVIPLHKATFVADSITVVKGAFDPLPPVTVPDLKVMDWRFNHIAPDAVIITHATPQGWPTRSSKSFREAEAYARKLAAENRTWVKSELKKQSQGVIKLRIEKVN